MVTGWNTPRIVNDLNPPDPLTPGLTRVHLFPFQVNLFFLLNIVRVLITKLRVTHQAESSLYMRAVRATLILIPLLGIQFVLLAYKPQSSRALEIYLYIMDILMHYQVRAGSRLLRQQPGPDSSSSAPLFLLLFLQGFLVSTIFCFFNGEVSSQHVPAECRVQVLVVRSPPGPPESLATVMNQSDPGSSPPRGSEWSGPTLEQNLVQVSVILSCTSWSVRHFDHLLLVPSPPCRCRASCGGTGTNGGCSSPAPSPMPTSSARRPTWPRH